MYFDIYSKLRYGINNTDQFLKFLDFFLKKKKNLKYYKNWNYYNNIEHITNNVSEFFNNLF